MSIGREYWHNALRGSITFARSMGWMIQLANEAAPPPQTKGSAFLAKLPDPLLELIVDVGDTITSMEEDSGNLKSEYRLVVDHRKK